MSQNMLHTHAHISEKFKIFYNFQNKKLSIILCLAVMLFSGLK